MIKHLEDLRQVTVSNGSSSKDIFLPSCFLVSCVDLFFSLAFFKSSRFIG